MPLDLLFYENIMHFRSVESNQSEMENVQLTYKVSNFTHKCYIPFLQPSSYIIHIAFTKPTITSILHIISTYFNYGGLCEERKRSGKSEKKSHTFSPPPSPVPSPFFLSICTFDYVTYISRLFQVGARFWCTYVKY